MTFSAGPDGAAPLRMIAPGETVNTPEMHLGLVFGDLDNAVQAMHTHLRKSVFMPQARDRAAWVESGIGPELEITVEQVNHAIDIAAEVGAEVFFIDASWYAKPGSNWWKTVGDWDVDTQRFPEGIKPFRDKVHAAGMLWGLWMDAERVGSDSRVAKEHPDWLAMNYDGDREMGGQLDLTNPEAAQVDGTANQPRHRGEPTRLLPPGLQHRPGTRHSHHARRLYRKWLLAVLRNAVRNL